MEGTQPSAAGGDGAPTANRGLCPSRDSSHKALQWGSATKSGGFENYVLYLKERARYLGVDILFRIS